MAKPKSAVRTQPEYQLRHRLVGAIIVVGIAVLVIPLLLSKEDVGVNINRGTTTTTKTFHTKIDLPTAYDPAVDTSTEKTPPAQESGDQSKPTAIVVTTKTTSLTKAATKKTPAKKTTTQVASSSNVTSTQSTKQNNQNKRPLPVTSSTGWVVRAGTFSEHANIDTVLTLLAGDGFDVNETRVKTALGDTATRIWLGPYVKKETAVKVSKRLHALIGEKGFVTKHEP